MGEMAIRWEGDKLVGVIAEVADWKLNVIIKMRQYLM